jgi:hypothetical protein
MTMWAKYRKWKHGLVPPLAALAGSFLQGGGELSPVWFVGIGIAAFLGIAYLAEEVVWITNGQGRPCVHCGRKIPLRSFRVIDCDCKP